MICLTSLSTVYFVSRVGGWDNVLTAWRSEMGWYFLPLAVFCGEIVAAMDGMLMAESYRLGVKKSSIRLPWEHSSMSAIFGKR